MTTSDMYLNANPNQLLTEFGAAYTPMSLEQSLVMTRARPVFNYPIIEEMLMDPRIQFGLMVIKGPIAADTRFSVKAESPEVEEFAITQINRFWTRCIGRVLEGVEWGYSSSEVLYEVDSKGDLVLAGLNSFSPKDVKVIAKNGVRHGIVVQNVRSYGYDFNQIYLGGPKHFHYVHWRHFNKYYGRSRLWSTLVPWWEIWTKGGYRDTRRLWFGKNAFNGGMIRYPRGSTTIPGRGEVSNHDLAIEMATKMATGSVAVAPSTRSSSLRENEWDWMFEPVRPNSVPGGLLEYGGLLRIEIFESMGIPYEVVEASGNEGFGSSSGRSIPLLAYNAILYEIVQDIIRDFREQILDFLIMMKFKKKMDYEVLPLPLQTPDQEQANPNTSPQDDQELRKSNKDSKKDKKEDTEEDSDTESSEIDDRNDDRLGVARSA